MKYNNVGNSGLKVSELSLGSNNFGMQVSEEEAIRIVKKAVDLGINSIDTADVYTQGRSEEIIGKAVQGYRDKIVLETKVGSDGGASRRNIIAKAKQSMERFHTDYIDLYYIHRFDETTPLEETMSTLNDLVHQGKVRYIACSNFSGAQMAQARQICESRGYEQFIAIQPRYNMIQRNIEVDVIPEVLREKVGVLPYSPLMGGFLVGKYTKGGPAPAGSRGAYNQRFMNNIDAANYERVEKLQAIATEAHVSLMELAIGWLLKKPVITSVIVGASKAEQVAETVTIPDKAIGDDVVSKVDALTAMVATR